MNPAMPPKQILPGVKNVIAVASGKGGVGKSTVAANLAMALHMSGKAVGLMDADIYGPSVPIMFGLGKVDQNTTPFPIEKFGIRLMSMGFLIPPETAMIWRGPKVAQAVQSFLAQIVRKYPDSAVAKAYVALAASVATAASAPQSGGLPEVQL